MSKNISEKFYFRVLGCVVVHALVFGALLYVLDIVTGVSKENFIGVIIPLLLINGLVYAFYTRLMLVKGPEKAENALFALFILLTYFCAVLVYYVAIESSKQLNEVKDPSGFVLNKKEGYVDVDTFFVNLNKRVEVPRLVKTRTRGMLLYLNTYIAMESVNKIITASSYNIWICFYQECRADDVKNTKEKKAIFLADSLRMSLDKAGFYKAHLFTIESNSLNEELLLNRISPKGVVVIAPYDGLYGDKLHLLLVSLGALFIGILIFIWGIVLYSRNEIIALYQQSNPDA